MKKFHLDLSKGELDFLIQSIQSKRPFIYEIEAKQPQALMYRRVSEKLADALKQ